MNQNTNQGFCFNTKWIQVLVFSVLLITISCGAKELPNPSEQKMTTPTLELPDDTHFDIQFETKQVGYQRYYLTAALTLDEGSYVISPFSEDTFYMHFNILLDENDFIKAYQPILETPASVIEFDTIIKTPVRFVRQNTTYKQAIKIKKQDDFTTKGIVELLVEPSCIPYHVEFTLSYQSGALNIQKTETRFHPSYKGR